MSRPRLFAACLAMGWLIATNCCSFGQDKPADAKDKTEPETVTAVAQPVEIFEVFDGVLESTNVGEIMADVKARTDLEIKTAVEQGTRVDKGDLVLNFDTDDLDRLLSEARFAVETAQLDHEDAKLSAAQMKATLELDQELADRTFKNAKEDYEYYQDTSRPQQLKDLDYRLKSANWSLEYAQEELDQLKKMYNEDELTEESELIVLKRAERSVESAERNLENTELNVKRTRETSVPRADIQQADQLQRASLSYAKSQITLPIQSQRTQIALKKSEFELSNKQQKLDELTADAERRSLSSPMDGILYHGQCKRGKWAGAGGSAATRVLEPGKKVAPRKVVMTVVDPTQMMIRTDLEEKSLKLLKTGQAGTALINASPDGKLSVVVDTISRIPLINNKFDCRIKIADLNNDDHHLMPGMTCKVSIPVYRSNESIVVPSASVFTDDQVTHYVYRMDGDEPQKTPVTVGQVSGNQIEIKAGLAAGDKILKEKPKS